MPTLKEAIELIAASALIFVLIFLLFTFLCNKLEQPKSTPASTVVKMTPAPIAFQTTAVSQPSKGGLVPPPPPMQIIIPPQ